MTHPLEAIEALRDFHQSATEFALGVHTALRSAEVRDDDVARKIALEQIQEALGKFRKSVETEG